ncbi:MAG: type ISP restriction/modification enzyme, partial [Candidatus Delongbacteria bacterium]
MTLQEYISSINTRYKLGNATEHTFRGDLQQLIESMEPGVRATNEPKRQKCGAPDFILTRKDIPVGFIEAKDIGDPDLDGNKKTGNKEQFDRYKNSLNNLIFTDYLNFHFYTNGVFSQKITIGEVQNGKIVPVTRNFESFTYLLKYFCTHIGQTIKSSKQLAQMMANKARLLADIIEKALLSDEETQENSTLKDQMNAFREILIHDITPKGFADVYAQTIAYGMFAARLHDTSLDTFSRQEAAELIPRSNPFLRKLFAYIAGPDLDDRIKWIVDNLTEIFLACNVEELLRDYGRETKTEDPIIHFYETFLSEYDPKLRKSRGVWYTPQPVVNFIVRAVDDILKTEFNLPQGLADSSRTKDGVHKVQILDPAAGTGTFLAEVIRQIHSKFEGQQGIWSNYVENHLLPRLNGFELLMASYAMAHLKLDILLKETGYKPAKSQRFRVYLTNSLEEFHPDTGTLFASWLSSEANEANHIKRDTPVMVVMGNPPYSGESANKGEWIMKLMEDYKKEPGGIEKLNERNPKWINDDYVKFLRYGQFYIERNGSGVLAFINAHGFLDNPTFRGMRWNLLKTYDKIYIIDLHGNAKKKETCHDGSKDENVFDIMQGVSINIFVKTGKKKKNELGQVYHLDLFGKRDYKYKFLNTKKLESGELNNLYYSDPNYFFVHRNYNEMDSYNKGIAISDLFSVNNSGVSTDRDSLFLDNDKKELEKRIQMLLSGDFSYTYKSEYNVEDSSGYPILKRIMNKIYNNSYIQNYQYRPFDFRQIYYDESIISRPAKIVAQHVINKENQILIVPRQVNKNFHHIFVSRIICDSNITSSARLFGAGKLFPLYLYPEKESKTASRTPNLNSEIVQKIADGLGLKFTNEKEADSGTFAPIDILDYIYAVLHSPTYREKYKEFLKIDFPRVPYPKNKETFCKLVK